MYLILRFTGAALFSNHRGTKDRASIFNEPSKGRDNINFKEPITKYQISNLLHVLMGERPVSTVRGSVYDKINWIDEITTDRTYLKYTNYPVNETITLNKSAYNSWTKSSYINWEIIRQLLTGNEDIIDKIIELIPNASKMRFDDVADYIRDRYEIDPKYSELMSIIEVRTGIKSLYQYIKDSKNASQLIVRDATNKRRGTARTITNGIDSVKKYNGEIVVKLSDDELNIIRNNYKGCATLLDGGVVDIIDVKDELEYSYMSDFVIVGEISTDKVEPKMKKQNETIIEI